MKKRFPTDELLRLACIYAAQDRGAYIDSIRHTKDAEQIKETEDFLREIRAYRLKRWGKTYGEVAVENSRLVPIQLLHKRK